MSEGTLRGVGGYLVDHWYLIPLVVILVVAIAVAYHWISEKLGV
jgi:hypothetical protein